MQAAGDEYGLSMGVVEGAAELPVDTYSSDLNVSSTEFTPQVRRSTCRCRPRCCTGCLPRLALRPTRPPRSLCAHYAVARVTQGGCPPTGAAQQPYAGQASGMGAMSMGGYGPPDGGYGPPDGGYGPPDGSSSGWYGDGMGGDYGEEAEGMDQSVAQTVPDGPCVTVPALSFRQPLASLVLFGVKQIENRNRPTLKQMQGGKPALRGRARRTRPRATPPPCKLLTARSLDSLYPSPDDPGPLALHVSHKEEPYGSPVVSTAINILRRRYNDEQIQVDWHSPGRK